MSSISKGVRIRQREQIYIAIDCRKRGLSWGQIGQKLHRDRRSVQRSVQNFLNEKPAFKWQEIKEAAKCQ